MSITSWLRNRVSHSRSRSTGQRQPGLRVCPQLEALEDRCLPSTLTVTSPKDHGPGTLRADIVAAHNGDTIVFSPKLDRQTITLTSGELDLTKNLTIQGPGAGQLTISGDNLSRVFEVALNITVSLSGMTISNGDSKASEYATAPLDGYGGAILNKGTLTVSGCSVSNNFADDGGGIYNAGTIAVSGCTISNNSVDRDGGGIYNAGTATVSITTVSLNVAANGFGGTEGGGIYNAGALTVLDSIFSSNSPDAIYGPYTDGGGNTFN